jgi:hypothetical protein
VTKIDIKCKTMSDKRAMRGGPGHPSFSIVVRQLSIQTYHPPAFHYNEILHLLVAQPFNSELSALTQAVCKVCFMRRSRVPWALTCMLSRTTTQRMNRIYRRIAEERRGSQALLGLPINSTSHGEIGPLKRPQQPVSMLVPREPFKSRVRHHP